ncbi:hypothetical protein [Bradyrhizobium sp. 164]|uniref:hypothetical protein n=1 Tax=Bradyrhizobium sp. 164 TaxID=2782637 RepID=UPI001FF8494D|nr:hypothetical protein [Bradyrhizobium sp. 164]MCK1595480.1 hypothetical protein [Bradyrhizobium sp. 164]
MQMLKTKTPPLEDRITAFRADLNRFIDERVAEIKKQCPGVPETVLRLQLMGKSGCECRTVLAIKAKDAQEVANGVA